MVLYTATAARVDIALRRHVNSPLNGSGKISKRIEPKPSWEGLSHERCFLTRPLFPHPRTPPVFQTSSLPGDGANDVPMIQRAHIGVGISGQEGMQVTKISKRLHLHASAISGQLSLCLFPCVSLRLCADCLI